MPTTVVDDLPPYHDDIPNYAASLEFYGLSLLKIEFDTPWNCHLSPLKPVVAELNSNQLRLYEFKADRAVISAVEALYAHQNYDDGCTGKQVEVTTDAYLFDGDAYGDDDLSGQLPTVVSKLRKHYSDKKIKRTLKKGLPAGVANNGLLFEPTSDSTVYSRFAKKYRGKLLHCYTLQNLAVGEAPSVNLQNYKEDPLKTMAHSAALLNYRNALRLRVEHVQLLLHFWSFQGMVQWYRNLSIGRDLASLLDSRVVVRFKSIPHNFSARNNALLEASAREALCHEHNTIMKQRASVTSLDSYLNCSSLSSLDSMESLLTGASSVDCSQLNLRLTTDVYGEKIVCYENLYTPAEKQYISNCIPTLNSYDKWAGNVVTVSNYHQLLPKNDSQNINQDGKVFILRNTFNSLVKGHMKNFHKSLAAMTNECKDFYVDDTGLVSIETSL